LRKPEESSSARFERLLGEYGSAIERMAAAYETEPNERLDLMQEIAFALWRALPGFRDDCSEKTFIYRIAQNRGLTHRWRRRARETRTVDLDDVQEQLADPASETELPTALSNITREELLVAVQRLPGLQRDVLVLSLEGLTNGEIADVLGISPGNVAVRLTRARGALRNTLTRETKS
jgi:RNA polymerase sigma-70 factor (ECF subfamily)